MDVMQPQLKFGQPWNPNGIFKPKAMPSAILTTTMGVLFDGDCLEVLPTIADESINTVFADPPFNIGKTYGSGTKVDDRRPELEYVEWCKAWINECARTLKPGGSFFLYNLPKWNILLGAHLNDIGMTFKHWIAVDIKLSLPIQGRLYPSHYSLLYYVKGPRPKTFKNVRTPIKLCRHCGGEVKDYGGHRDAMNPKGVNLADVWDDIPPVRHWKFKSKKRKANQLSTKLLNRVLQISTNEGDVVLDPFGGAGTTFDVCEHTHRHWIGMELENCDVIIERLEGGDLHHHEYDDFVEDRRTAGAGQKKTHTDNKKRKAKVEV